MIGYALCGSFCTLSRSVEILTQLKEKGYDILPRDLLMGLQPDTLLIDLASAPFGVSDDHVREAAAQNGLRYLRAPSLPGSYAPCDAGRAIAECILGMVTHRNSSDETNREGGTPL
jgi:hypothetical protein